jgi:hypothetical protein
VIVLAVRWYLRFGLSYRDVEELLTERGVEVDHVTVYRWVLRFTPLLQSFAVVGECCGLRNRPQSAPTRSAMASAEEPAGLRTAKFRRYTLSFDNVL